MVNLLNIFYPTTSSQHLDFIAKLGSTKIGTGNYQDRTPTPSYVNISGDLDYDGWGKHLHGPIQVSIEINDHENCTLTFSGENFTPIGPAKFPYVYVKQNKFYVEIKNYTDDNGDQSDGTLTFVGEGDDGTKINPHITTTPKNNPHKPSTFDHGIVVRPENNSKKIVRNE